MVDLCAAPGSWSQVPLIGIIVILVSAFCLVAVAEKLAYMLNNYST